MKRRIVATYQFVDEHGEILYEEVRFEPKEIKQRRPDGNGGWIWNLDGVRRILYRLPELLDADPGRMVLVPEGPRKADALAKLGFVATSNAGGAGKWLPEFSEVLRGRHVAILPDNDNPGLAHAAILAGSLMTHGAASLRTVILTPHLEHGDVVDYLKAGGTRPDIERRINAAEAWVHKERQLV